MKPAIPSDLIAGLEKRDRRALGKAISILENDGDGKKAILDYACQHEKENRLVVGITGTAGAGKSTLIDKMIQIYRSQGLRIGIIAVDPTSPYTGGAILGDRIRMSVHNADRGVFLRSFASRGAQGGMSRAAKEALYLYKAFPFDIIIVESLGVGQAETDIRNYVDVTVVVLAPGNGDDIQLSKAGTQEIADIFVINKADRPEAETLRLQLTGTFGQSMGQERPLPAITMTVATKNEGVDKLVSLMDNMRETQMPEREKKARARIENEILTGALQMVEAQLRVPSQMLAKQVLRGEMTSYDAIRLLEKQIHIEKKKESGKE